VIVIGEVADLGSSAGARPLHGVTVVVTRPASQGGDLVRELELAGARVLEIPTVAITGPRTGGLRCGSGGRGRLLRVGGVHVGQCGAPLLRRAARRALVGAARVAAVGHATSAALADHGIEADLVPRSRPPRARRVHRSTASAGGEDPVPEGGRSAPGPPAGAPSARMGGGRGVAYRSAAADPPPAAVAAELASATW